MDTPRVEEQCYRDIPFSSETRYGDFYTYVDLKDIPEKFAFETHAVVKCRTIGILQSLGGRFYLTAFDSSGTESEPLVQVSMAYLQIPPPSTVMPYPVQIFGTVQWKNRAVIFAKILQILKAPIALRLKNALNAITSIHLARNIPSDNQEDI